MTVRAKTLWRVPVFCTIASWLTYYITIYLGGFFFTVRTQGVDGTVEVSADPVRSAVFTGVLFLAILLAGGLWAFRSMTRREIAASAALLPFSPLFIWLLSCCNCSCRASRWHLVSVWRRSRTGVHCYPLL